MNDFEVVVHEPQNESPNASCVILIEFTIDELDCLVVCKEEETRAD